MTPMLKKNPNFEKMSVPEIESTTAMLLLAGSETTGTTLCGTTNYLVQNPYELRKLEREIRNTFQMDSDITLRALQNLPFLNAVIWEGLRLCNPVAGGILRIVPKGGDTVCGYFLPGGVSIVDYSRYGGYVLMDLPILDTRNRQFDHLVTLRRQLPSLQRLSARPLPP